MRTLAMLAAALTLAACAGSAAGGGTPPVRHVELSALPEQHPHDDPVPLDPRGGPVEQGDPAAVAVALIVDGLGEQGLEVVDLGVETARASADAATIRIAATHQAGTSGPSHTSVYEVDLARDPDGPWRSVGFRQAH